MFSSYWNDRHAIFTKIKQKLSLFADWCQKKVGKLVTQPPANLVGLDIGSDTLKLMKINSSKSPFTIEYYSIIPTPPGAIIKDEIKDHAAIGNAIRTMFKQTNITSRNVALALPRSLAIIKNISVDSRLTDEEIESRAWVEANRHFPDLVGDIYLDFTVSKNPQDTAQLDIIIVACRKDQVKPYLEVLHNAGLSAKLIDVNCYALDRALPLVTDKETAQQTIALLNLNVNLSTLIVSHHQELIYSHDQSFDGQRLLTQIRTYQKDHGLNPSQGVIDDAEYANILKENLISHLRHTIHFFYSSRPNMAIQHILIAGDCASIPGIASFIQREIGIETSLANPLAHLTLAPEINEDEFKLNAPMLIQSCGLALGKVDYE